MNMKERMLAGLPYKAWLDGLEEERMECKSKLFKYNQTHPNEADSLDHQMRDILGSAGENITLLQPVYFDYGKNIEIGNNFFSNYNLVILDVGKVIIGDNVMFAPNVSIYTAGHPIHPETRNTGYEYGISITIGDNVWIGGSAVINCGVKIGNNVVIGSGSVVTKDIPDNSVAVGNPARIIRTITDKDKGYYFKDKKIEDL